MYNYHVNIHDDSLYYGCPSGSYYEGGSCKTTKCGDGIVNSEHCESVGSEYTCKFTVGRNEVCDDGGQNGQYAGVATGSNCKSDCSGKIKNTSGSEEYYCGDKVVQYKSGDTCYAGSACKQVTEGNYPGATVSAFTQSEQCDPKSGANDRATLCKSKGYGDHTYYDNTASSPSCTNDCKVSASQYEGCGYCGDGKVQKASGTLTYVAADYTVSGASEYCDPGKDYNSDTGTKELCNAKLNQSRSSYYTPSTRPTCSGGCAQSNITATKGTHCQWCGDGSTNGSEKCDGNTTTCYKQDGTYTYDCNQWGSNCSTGKYFDYYNVNCSGSCAWTLGSLYSDNNKFNSGSPSITACSSLGL